MSPVSRQIIHQTINTRNLELSVTQQHQYSRITKKMIHAGFLITIIALFHQSNNSFGVYANQVTRLAGSKAFLLSSRLPSTVSFAISVPPAGAIDEVDEDDDDDDEEMDEEEDDEDVEEPVVTSKKKSASISTFTAPIATKKQKGGNEKMLAAAAIKSVTKTKTAAVQNKVASVKKVVNTKLFAAADKEESAINKKTKSTTIATSSSSIRIPYVLKAFLNPITVFTMTRAYWASLFNLNYLKNNEPTIELRSAQEEKAKKYNPSALMNQKKGKRKMKPGQAKSLNDLPKLSTCPNE